MQWRACRLLVLCFHMIPKHCLPFLFDKAVCQIKQLRNSNCGDAFERLCSAPRRRKSKPNQEKKTWQEVQYTYIYVNVSEGTNFLRWYLCINGNGALSLSQGRCAILHSPPILVNFGPWFKLFALRFHLFVFFPIAKACVTISSTWSNFKKSIWNGPHLEWWQFLLTIFLQRKPFHQQPLSAAWVPSHVCDDIPFERLTVHDATSRGTTLQHIFHNRCADSAAKSTLKNLHGNLITNYHPKISKKNQGICGLLSLQLLYPPNQKSQLFRNLKYPMKTLFVLNHSAYPMNLPCCIPLMPFLECFRNGIGIKMMVPSISLLTLTHVLCWIAMHQFPPRTD